MTAREGEQAAVKSLFGRLLRRAGLLPADAPLADITVPVVEVAALPPAEGVVAVDPNAPHAMIDLDGAVAPLLPLEAREAFAHHRCEAGQYDWRSDAGRRGGSGSDRKIAFLGSAELLRELAFDAAVTVPDVVDWQETMAAGRFDYLLIETAWELAGRGWEYGLVSDGAGRPAVEQLLAHCKRIGLPVVVWFREDVANYPRFAWLVQHAARCYAVSDTLVEQLQADWPEQSAALLPVAIQPAIHNPLCPEGVAQDAAGLANSVLFDGWWDLMGGGRENSLLRSLLDDGLVVIESEWEYSNVQLADSPDYGARAIGSLSPAGRLAISKFCAAEVFLQRSISLPWRNAQRMLRSAASGCIPLQVGEGQSLIDGLELPVRGDEESLLAALRGRFADPVERARYAQLALRELLRSHCLEHRLQQIEEDLGLQSADGATEPHPRVACILVTRRPELLPACLAWFRREHYPNKELIVVVHGGQPVGDLPVQEGETVRQLHMGPEHSLGECLNFAIAQSEAPYWAKIDDDDFYGDHYLHDLMSYRAIRDFDLIGKPPQFLYLEDGDELRWDQVWHEHSWLLHGADGPRAVQVAGGSLLGRRALWDEVRFSRRRRAGSDSEFIMRCYALGHDLMVADGFNFVRYRSARADFHTWQVADESLRSRSSAVGNGKTLPGIALI